MFWVVRNLIFGANGVLTFKNESNIDPDQRQKMYVMQENVQRRQIIPIPKIIYRVIELKHGSEWYDAVIVIHNDPNPVQDNDRLCKKSEEVPGWQTIKNDDPKTGLTYVCHFDCTIKRVVDDKLSFCTENNEVIYPLDLDYMRHNCKKQPQLCKLFN